MLVHRLSSLVSWDGNGGLELASTWKPDLEESTCAVAAAGNFLAGWPSTFHAAIERAWQAVASRDPAAKPNRDVFKVTLMDVFAGRDLSFVRREFSAYFKRRFEPSLVRAPRKPMKPKKPAACGHDAVPVAAAAELLGVCKDVVRKYVARGRVKSDPVASRRGGVLAIARQEVADVAQKERLGRTLDQARADAAAITRNEAAAALGVGRRNMEVLLRSGLLGTTDVSVHFRKYLSRTLLESLVNRLETGSTDKIVARYKNGPANDVNDDGLIRLTDISGAFSLPDLLQAILAEQILPDMVTTEDAGLRRLFYGSSKIERMRRTLAGNHLTRDRAASELGCSPISVGRMLDAGILDEAATAVVSSKQGSGHPCRILASSVASVAARFVSTGGIARAVRQHPKRLKPILARLDLVPEYDLGSAETTLWLSEKILPALLGMGFSLTLGQLSRGGRSQEL